MIGDGTRGDDEGCCMKLGNTCGVGEGARGVDVFCMTFIMGCWATSWGGGVGEADLVMMVGFCLM